LSVAAFVMSVGLSVAAFVMSVGLSVAAFVVYGTVFLYVIIGDVRAAW
jgi:hypothetical protein